MTDTTSAQPSSQPASGPQSQPSSQPLSRAQSQASSPQTMRDRLVGQFELIPHPEGGYFRETYRAGDRVSRASTGDVRSASTAIYYLLSDDAYSAWHRIRSDEVWHFYAGGALDVHVLTRDGSLVTHRLGNALERDDAVFQAVVEAGQWFAAERVDPEGFAFVGCTVAPGFEFSEFELADVDALLAEYPGHSDIVRRLAPRS